jgi:hypothetical protein
MYDMACNYDTISSDVLFVLRFRIIAKFSIHYIFYSKMSLLAPTMISLIDWQSIDRTIVQQVKTTYYGISLQVQLPP